LGKLLKTGSSSIDVIRLSNPPNPKPPKQAPTTHLRTLNSNVHPTHTSKPSSWSSLSKYPENKDQENVFNSLELLKRQKWSSSFTIKPSQPTSVSGSPFQSQVSVIAPKCKEQESCQLSVKAPLTRAEPFIRNPATREQNIYNFKCALINHYAEDIFDQIAPKHFPLSISEKSVYLPYRQFLLELQQYLNSHG
jgi:hypothetical protein